MSAPTSASTTLPLLRDFPDWHSPMVVKEMRHGLRTRFFASALVMLHALLAALMLSALAGADQEIITNVFWTITFILLLVVMPLRGFAALSSEARAGTLDMLRLTSISSFRITYGKWVALLSQTLLIASSLLPYMVARYQFGGVEILREGAALAILVLGSALSTAALVGFSSQKSILLRLLLLIGVGMTSIPFSFMITVSLIETFGDDALRDFLLLDGWEQVGLVAGLLFAAGYGVFLFLSLGASRIAPASENHSTVKRLVALGVMLLLAVIGWCLAAFHPTRDIAMGAFMPALIFTLIVGVDVMTEAMPRFPTVAVPFVARGKVGRMMGRFLYPGWASGVAFYTVLCLFPIAIVACSLWIPHRYISASEATFAICSLICGLTAAVVPVCVRVHQKNRFAHWWVVQLIILTLGVVMVTLIEVTGLDGFKSLGLVTPGTALMAFGDLWRSNSIFLKSGAGIGLLWTLMALCMAWREMRTYRRLETEVAALQTPQTTPRA